MQTIWENINPESLKDISKYQVISVMWWGKWDEWKWWDALALATHIDYEYILWLIWWPNAWHTAIKDNWDKFVWHNLPGSALTWKNIFLGQGKYINIKWLQSEIKKLNDLWVNPKINIAYSAHCLFSSFHWTLDGSIENSKKIMVMMFEQLYLVCDHELQQDDYVMV